MILLKKLKLVIPAVIALICAAIIPALAFNIIEPYTGQIVKENIRIAIPESAIPSEGYVSLYIYGDNFPEIFAGAFNQRNAITKNGQVIYYWDSKKPYFDITDPKAMKTLPDGKYTLRIQIHKSNSTETLTGKDTENAATVQFTLKNNITTAANFSVSLYNRLDFGQVNTYTIKADVSVLDSVGIPIMQELGLGAKWNVIQSVEDVTPDGLRMIRYRIGETAFTTINGNQTNLYSGVVNKPQLYRIVDKYGNVSVANLFSKQSNTIINDILPVLPSKKVRLDSNWPDKLTIKVEGLTDKIVLKGDAKLESFEWQDGKPCAKIVSNLGGQGSVVLANGLINGVGSPMSARVTTYIDYKAAKMLVRVIDLEFPCVINSGGVAANYYYTPQGGNVTSSGNISNSNVDNTMGYYRPGNTWDQAIKEEAFNSAEVSKTAGGGYLGAWNNNRSGNNAQRWTVPQRGNVGNINTPEWNVAQMGPAMGNFTPQMGDSYSGAGAGTAPTPVKKGTAKVRIVVTAG